MARKARRLCSRICFPASPKKLSRPLGFGTDPQHAGFVVWVILSIALSSFLNVRGIKWTAHANLILTAVMFLVIGIFVVDAVHFLALKSGWGGLFSTLPIYNPHTFNLRAVGTATSLAAVTYVGFDGITTLAEDVRDPKRTVPLAIVLVCIVIGLCAFLQTYLGQLVWPDYNTFKDLDMAFFDVCKLVGGKFLFDAMTLTMAVACLGSALTGQVGAARILFGMGRDNALPRFLARLDHRNNPVLNIWLIGLVVLAASLLLKYEGAVELVNFGAFLAFMGVNLAVIREFCFRPPAGHKANWFSRPCCSCTGVFVLPLDRVDAQAGGQNCRRHLVRPRFALYRHKNPRFHPATGDAGFERIVIRRKIK